jgi:hypothetical protein
MYGTLVQPLCVLRVVHVTAAGQLVNPVSIHGVNWLCAAVSIMTAKARKAYLMAVIMAIYVAIYVASQDDNLQASAGPNPGFAP